MKNKIITAVSLTAVLSISIFFVMLNLPVNEESFISYRDSFEYQTNASDFHKTESSKVIISAKDFPEVYSSHKEINSHTEQPQNSQEENKTVPFSNNNNTYSSFFEDDFDQFDDDDEEKEVYVSVYDLEDSLAKGYVSFENGDTVYDVTQKLLKKNDIKIGKRGGGATLYIYKIGDLEEKDYGPMSGWVYTVNGERVNTGCGSYKVSDGDVIDWQYNKD